MTASDNEASDVILCNVNYLKISCLEKTFLVRNGQCFAIRHTKYQIRKLVWNKFVMK
jgi:hypothetical protein